VSYEALKRLPVVRDARRRAAILRGWRSLKRHRRLLAERLGSDRYSHPALDELDRRLEAYLPAWPGTFVEAGANDGYRQSNTYYLERFKGWTGLLVEPVPTLAALARRDRPRSEVVNAALVASDYPASMISVRSAGLVSSVEGTAGWANESLGEVLDGASHLVDVPARSLSSLLDEFEVHQVDFLCLDVEGYEEQVLAGLDLERHAPRVMLLESFSAAAQRRVEAWLTTRYVLAEQMTDRDWLYTRTV
jgi:FkbM family methyltransferase